MRMTHLFAPTRREDPADAEVASHRFLVRAGFIRQNARGIYTLLPLGWRVVRKIEQIVREEMDRAGAQEMRMPAVQPAELWEESGRIEKYGPALLRFKDRKGGDLVLGPTHEEIVTDLMRSDLTSYKSLPVCVYQMQTKFRDEPRPRFGLMRGREFIMKDAYSFDLDVEGSEASYDRMFAAYGRIFSRFGFAFRAVEADSGNIGGQRSHEFQVLAETGEDLIASDPKSDYAANVEKAELAAPEGERADASGWSALERHATPGARTIAEVVRAMGVAPERLVKTLIYLVDGEPVAALVRGDRSVNPVKLADACRSIGMSAADLELADDESTARATKAPVGFAGPVGLPEGTPIIMDAEVALMADMIVGANKKDEHLSGVNWGRDFSPSATADLRIAQPGDLCPRSGEPYEFSRGIEVGHVFDLGTVYSEAMGASLQGEGGELRPMRMGCYGIGITRIMAAAVEQSHDEAGPIWPMPIAPYQVAILPLQSNKPEVVEAAERLYEALQEAGVEALLDDRDQRAGAKFKDADLYGIPLRVAIGSRGLAEGTVEFKRRGAGEVRSVALEEIPALMRRAIAGGTPMTSARVIAALDVADRDEALRLADALSGVIERVKIGSRLFTRCGPELVLELGARGLGVFLDLKFHDIPSVVGAACREAAGLEPVFLITVHALGGRPMIEEAVRGARAGGRARVVAVTALTSHDDAELSRLGLPGGAGVLAARLAAVAERAGADGVVSSAAEVARLRSTYPDFVLVTPGIRPAGSARGDQRRTATPAEAARAGSDFLVVGRPIYRADDPAAAARAIVAEVAS